MTDQQPAAFTANTPDGPAVVTVESIDTDVELSPLELGRGPGLRGYVVVLRSHTDGQPDVLAAFAQTTTVVHAAITTASRDGMWRQVSGEYPPGGDWRAHRTPLGEQGHPVLPLREWLSAMVTEYLLAVLRAKLAPPAPTP